ncbi:hypothetical protein ACOMHN_042263 [Nucella lapillus]
MERKGLETGDKVRSIQSSSLDCIAVRMRVMDCLPQACQAARSVSPALPPTYLNIKWYHRVSNVKVLLQAQMPSIYALLTQSQLRWSGYLVRMQDSRLPKQLFYGELIGGHRPRGRPKLRYKDTLKKSLRDIDEKRWEFLATNRSEWRQAIRKGREAYENERQVSQVEKRAATKVRLNCAERSIKCPLCNRLCASDFGLRSHMRVHK